jgi:acetate kinase
MPDAILTLNAGSSSLKFSLYGAPGAGRLTLACRGEVEGLGSAPHFVARDLAGAVLTEQRWADPQEDFAVILATVMDWAEAHLGGDDLTAVGHRVVHGGVDYSAPARVTPEVLARLEALSPLAPLHQPHNLAPIRAIAAARPNLPQVACFDTAFHRTMPRLATRFALPREYDEAGVRRYGFHGLSYEYIAGRLAELDPDLAKGRVIVAHLGAGASLCAMQEGRSLDTTMGFTALEGLMMGTRCGAIDPGVLLYLEQQQRMTPDAVQDLLYNRSGLLGVSGGIASDMRELLASPDPRAREAIELFVHRIVREAAALTSALGGLDGVVFTAGIGEHAAEIRAMVAERLAWLGAELDPAANARHAPVISAPVSRLQLRVIPTDEEAMIARHTLDLTDERAREG